MTRKKLPEVPKSPRHAPPPKDAQKKLDRAAQAFGLKRAGATYEQVGDQLGITRQAAHRLVHRWMQKLIAEMIEDAKGFKAMQSARIEDAILSVTTILKEAPKVGKDGHPVEDRAWVRKLQAVDRLVRLLERQANLHGLDAPKKLAETDSQGNDLEDSAKARLRARMLASAADMAEGGEPGGDPHS